MKTLKSSSEVNELVSMYIPELPTERIAQVAQSVDATARLSFLGAAEPNLPGPVIATNATLSSNSSSVTWRASIWMISPKI